MALQLPNYNNAKTNTCNFMGTKCSNRTVTVGYKKCMKKAEKIATIQTVDFTLSTQSLINHLGTAILPAWLKSFLLYISNFSLICNSFKVLRAFQSMCG